MSLFSYSALAGVLQKDVVDGRLMAAALRDADFLVSSVSV
jgi:hypothetical protein